MKYTKYSDGLISGFLAGLVIGIIYVIIRQFV